MYLHDCQNNGQCVDGINDFTCDCTGTGFEGDKCENNINDCISHNCQNNGQCIDGINDFTCDCTGTGFDGDACENNINDCISHDCQNNGQCVDGINDFTCDCSDTGFEGDKYEIVLDKYLNPATNLCENDSACTYVLSQDILKCDCTLDYYGKYCQKKALDINQASIPTVFRQFLTDKKLALKNIVRDKIWSNYSSQQLNHVRVTALKLINYYKMPNTIVSDWSETKLRRFGNKIVNIMNRRTNRIVKFDRIALNLIKHIQVLEDYLKILIVLNLLHHIIQLILMMLLKYIMMFKIIQILMKY